MTHVAFRSDVRMLTERLDLALIQASKGGSYADLVEEAANVVTSLRAALDPPTTQRLTCTRCFRRFAVRQDGTVWAHTTRTGVTRCEGSHKYPKEI